MKLLSMPMKPKSLPLIGEEIDIETAPEEWEFFLQGHM